MKLTATIGDQMVANRFDRVRVMRGYKKPSRAVRELAVERLQQVETYGDCPMVPAQHVGHSTPQPSPT